jgi:hypothetical protein
MADPFRAEAHRVHARLLELKRHKNLLNAELAQLLAKVARERLYRAFERTSVGDYAVHFGFTRSAGKARDLVKMVKDLEAAPTLRAAFERGDYEWTKVRLAAAEVAAHPHREGLWTKRLDEGHTNEELETLAREDNGDPEPVRWTLKLSREQEAHVEQALTVARALHGRTLTDAEALDIICRSWRATQAGGGEEGRSSDRPANRIVIHRCECGGKAWQETRSGRVAVSPEELDAAMCDAEISDVRDGPARISKTIPPMIRRHVLDRDGHRCRVPGCSRVGYLHVHHEPGRAVSGHDPDRMVPLCDEHHMQRHLGLLVIREEGAGVFRFFRAEGTEIVAPPAPIPCSYERPAARLVLEKLGVPPDAARDAVEAAHAALIARGEPITLEALLKEVLGSLPPDGEPP